MNSDGLCFGSDPGSDSEAGSFSGTRSGPGFSAVAIDVADHTTVSGVDESFPQA